MRANARAAAGVAALAAIAGCGEGLRDGTGEVSVTRAVMPGPVALDLTLAQGRFHANHISQPATITLRRLPPGSLPHQFGPVFELDVDGATSFDKGLPYFEVTLPETPYPDADLRLATYKGGASDSGWSPLTSNYVYDPLARTLRGDLNLPAASGDVKLQIAAVLWCGNGSSTIRCPWAPYYCGQQGVCQ